MNVQQKVKDKITFLGEVRLLHDKLMLLSQCDAHIIAVLRYKVLTNKIMSSLGMSRRTLLNNNIKNPNVIRLVCACHLMNLYKPCYIW